MLASRPSIRKPCSSTSFPSSRTSSSAISSGPLRPASTGRAMRARTRAIMANLDRDDRSGHPPQGFGHRPQASRRDRPRAFRRGDQIVIMDEPTAALSYKEVDDLYAIVERLKHQGKAILFISHKFEEVFRIADHYAVFRDGKPVGDGMVAEADTRPVDLDDGRRERSSTSSPRSRSSPARPCWKSKASPIRPNSPTFPSRSTRARSSASTALSAPAAPRCAVALRRDRTLGRHGPDRRQDDRAPARPRRQSTLASSTCRKSAAARALSRRCRSSKT